MGDAEVSVHELQVVAVLLDGAWHDAQGVAETAEVAPRTARHHLTRLVDLGLVEVVRSFPRHRYRWTHAKGHPYLRRLREAGDALGIDLDDTRIVRAR